MRPAEKKTGVRTDMNRRFLDFPPHTKAVSFRIPAAMAAIALALGAAAQQPAAPSAAPHAPTSSIERLKSLSLEELMSIPVATVTTASRRTEQTCDAPGTIIIIDRSDILVRGYSTLKDVLRDLPGMETIEYFFSEIGTQVPVRGIAGNNKIVVLVNGMRVNPPGGEDFPFRNDFSVRNAERIEVVYGPGSTLYGQDAISAVINVITRRPKDGEGEAGVAGGTHGAREAWGSFSSIFGPDGEFGISGFIQYHDSELSDLGNDYPGWWRNYAAVSDSAQPAGLGRDPHREDYGLNMFVRLHTRHSSVQAWHRESERSSSEGFSPILGYLPEAIWGDSSTVVEGRNTLPLRENISLETCLTWNRYEIDPDSRYVFTVPDRSVGRRWFFDDYKYGIGTSFSGEEILRVDVTRDLKVTVGAMAATYDIIPKSTVPGGADPETAVVSQGGSFTYIDHAGITRQIPRVTRYRYETYAGYAEAAWQMHPRLKGVLGTRVTQDSRFDDAPATPRASLIFDVTEHLTAKYVFTRAYVAPSPYFGFSTYDNGALLATSNPDLEPEESDSHEINLSYNRENLLCGASVYYGEESDLIVLADRATPVNIVEPEVRLPDGSTRTLVRTANSGSSRNYGVDLYARARLGSISPWASYSYADFEEEQDDGDVPMGGISKHNVRAGLTWAATSRLFVTPSLVLRSTPEEFRPGPLDRELDTPYEVNLHVLCNATRRLDLFLDVRNLTNRKYALVGVTGDAIPQETFSAMAGARMKF